MAISTIRGGLHGYIDRMNEERDAKRRGSSPYMDDFMAIPEIPKTMIISTPRGSGKSWWAEEMKKVTGHTASAKDFAKEYLTEFKEPERLMTSTKPEVTWLPTSDAEERAVKRRRHTDALLHTVKLIHARWPHFCSRSVEMNGPDCLSGIVLTEECVENIIHASNMDRANFTFHRDYQNHVKALVAKWDSGFETQLIQWIESEEKRVADAEMTPEKIEAKRQAELEAELARITRLNDPVDELPRSLLEELSDGAVRAAARASTGEW